MTNVTTASQDLLNNDEHTVTAVDVLQAQTELEREAAAVLPGRFDQCTRLLGPTRQSAYACLTCSPTEPRGICYACSIACHAEHNLVELFERRRFLCDCAIDMPNGDGCQIERVSCNTATVADTASNVDEVINQQYTTASATTSSIPRNRYDHNYLGRFCR
jgi:E3 ubiquitin-protein ligase UBR7